MLYIRDRRGNFAVFAGLACIPLMLTMGGAIDLAAVYAEKQKVTNALDAAVIAAVRAPAGSEIEMGKSFFEANMGNDSSRYTLTLRLANESVTGSVSGSRENAFLKIANINSFDVSSTSVAELSKISHVKFTPISAAGYFPKNIFVFTKDRQGRILMREDVITYDYKISSDQKTIVPPLATATKVYDLGTHYDTFGVGMIVWDQHEDQRTGPTKTYYSDASNAADRLRVEGDCLTGQMNNWEDGGDSNFMDFVYELECSKSDSKLKIVK